MGPYESYTFFLLCAGVLGLLGLLITLKYVKGVVSPYPKADLGKRVVAGTIDAGICLLCYAVLSPMGYVVAAILGASYLLVRDGLFSGQSVGKRVAGLMVIHVGDGAPCAIWRSVGRNILLVIPGLNVVAFFFEFAVALCDEQGMRLGDRMVRTQVVEGKDVKDLVAALRDRMLRSLFEIKEANVSQGK